MCVHCPPAPREKARTRPHVLHDVDEQSASRGRDPFHRLAGTRGVDERWRECGRRLRRDGEVEGRDGAARDRRGPGRPLRGETDDRRPVDHLDDARLEGDRELHDVSPSHQIVLGLKGRERTIDERGAAPPGVDEGEGGNAVAAVTGAPTIDLDRLLERLPTREAPDDEGIPRRRELPRLHLTGEEDRVATRPGNTQFGAREGEAVRDEAARLEVELADRHRVLASVGERDQATILAGLHTVGAVPDPVRLLRRGERVEVEHGRPLRRGRAVGGERRAPPDPAHVRLVAPEVVELSPRNST